MSKQTNEWLNKQINSDTYRNKCVVNHISTEKSLFHMMSDSLAPKVFQFTQHKHEHHWK